MRNTLSGGINISTEDMIFELRRLYEKHKNDPVYTGETSWAMLCRDVADRLEELNGMMLYRMQ